MPIHPLNGVALTVVRFERDDQHGARYVVVEIAVAWQPGKPIIALPASGGWAERLVGEAIDPRRSDTIHDAASAEEAIALALSATRGVEPGDIGSGWRREAMKAKGSDEGEGRG